MVGANVVRDFTIGNTRIKIADNCYRGKTADDVERLLKRIAMQAQRQFIIAASTGNYGQKENAEIPADNRERGGGDTVFDSGICGDRQ